ncbi:MAG: PAS domain S-box protein [Candidatus Binatia bacterium]
MSEQQPRMVAWFAGVLVFILGALVLLGWALDAAPLKSVLPGWPQMVAATALAFVLAGTALVLTTAEPVSASAPRAEEKLGLVRRRGALGCASLVVLIGLLKLSEYVIGWDLGIDHLVFKESPDMTGSFPLSGMSPATAFTFLLLGSALLLALRSRAYSVFQVLTLLSGLIGWLGVSRYFYGGEPLFPYAQMAMHTALSFLILSAGILCTRTDGGLVALLISKSMGGVSARRLLPPALLVPLILGWLQLQGQRVGWYGAEAGLSLFALSNVIVFGALVWANATSLHRSDTERKRALETLQRSETFLVEAQQIAHVGSLEVYLDDKAASGQERRVWSEEMFRILGFAPGSVEPSQELYLSRVPPEDRQPMLKTYATVLAQGKPSGYEHRVVHPDGSVRFVYGQANLVQDQQTGQPLRMFITVQDITERKQAEEALKNSERRFRALIEHGSDSIAVIDADNNILYLSPSVATVEGYTAEELAGRNGIENTHPDDLPLLHETVQQLLDHPGQPIPVLWRRRHKNGHWIWLEGVATNLLHDPAVQGIVTNYRDVTDRKLAEQKLQAQLERLNLLNRITQAIGERQDLQSIFQVVIRSLEDNLPIDFDCLCLYDSADEALTVASVGVRSEALAMELAMSEQARIPIDQNGLTRCVRGQLVYEPDISQIQFPFPQRLLRGGLHALVVVPLLVESKVFGVLVAARRQPHSFSSGECEFLRQLSEHVALAAHQAQLYSALQQAYDDLRQTQQVVLQQERLRALGQMASGIAHDINNALSPVALYTESLLAQELTLSPHARERLEIVQRAIEDVTQTIAHMREFYRQREPQLTLTPVDLNLLMHQVVGLSRARWSDMPHQRGIVIKLVSELERNLPVIMGVESEIRDTLINLIFNAVDAMPDGGTLTLRTRTSESASVAGEAPPLRRVQVEVTDTGVGMDEKTRQRCLEPFFTTKGERGTGLGLAMVYGMVQRHSADMEIDSTVGEGTTVRLIFAEPIAAASRLNLPGDQGPAPDRLRLLIVDDDPLLLKSLRDTLEGDGHLITVADGGQAGVDAFFAARERGEPFAVVITDLGMPYMDGRKVAAAIKATAPTTPVILLTGWGQRLEAEGEALPHVDRILSKPPKLRELRAALAEATNTATRTTQS